MALGLPRRLAPVLPTTYSPSYLHLTKASLCRKHLGSPYHTSVYCKGYAPAAPRRARASVSVPFSGLPLSGPLPIFGLVVRYTANNLIGRRPILKPCVWEKDHSRTNLLYGLILTFAKLSRTKGQVSDVLLSSPPLFREDLHG